MFLPYDLIVLVAEYCATLSLLDWIPQSKRTHYGLRCNPLAAEVGLVDKLFLSTVTMSLDELIKGDRLECGGTYANPAAIDHIMSKPIPRGVYDFFSQNPHPRAVAHLLDNPGMIQWMNFSRNRNPTAVQYLREHPYRINQYSIFENPTAIDILIGLIRDGCVISWGDLASNPHLWAIEQMRLNQDKIEWEAFTKNPSIFAYKPNPWLIIAMMRA